MVKKSNEKKNIRPVIQRAKQQANPKTKRLVRVLAAACIIGIIGVAVFLIISKLSRPYMIGYSESKEIIETKQQISNAESENKSMHSDIQYLQTDRGKEAEARRLGWVKPGEIAIVVEQPRKIQNPSTQQAAATVHKSFWISVREKVLGLFK